MKKLNEIQKIILTIYVITFTSICLFYLPFYSGEYNTIWSDSGKVDLSKLGILILILTVILFTAIKFSESFNKYEEIKRKRILKKELKIFILFLSINICFLAFYYLNNGINYLNEKKLNNEISLNNTEIKNNLLKKQTRLEFWNYASYIYGAETFHNNIGELWDFMVENKEDENWLKYFQSNFDKEEIIKFKIRNHQEFKIFIEKNILREDDIIKEKNNIFLESENLEKEKEINKIAYYNSELIREYMVYIFLTSTLMLYILRIFIIKISEILKG